MLSLRNIWFLTKNKLIFSYGKDIYVVNKITFGTKVDVLVKVLPHCVFFNLHNSISQTNVQIINIHLSIKWTEMN